MGFLPIHPVRDQMGNVDDPVVVKALSILDSKKPESGRPLK